MPRAVPDAQLGPPTKYPVIDTDPHAGRVVFVPPTTQHGLQLRLAFQGLSFCGRVWITCIHPVEEEHLGWQQRLVFAEGFY